MRNDKLELLELLQKYPDLPLIFMAPTEEMDMDFTTAVFQEFSAYKSTIYEYDYYGNTAFTDDYADLLERYEDMFADEEDYKNLSDEEYENIIKKYIDDNIVKYEAIVISISA